MDTKIIAKGSRIYLPVFVEGALLAMGDLHAKMADGEVVICGVEVGGKVTVRVGLIKHKAIPTPVVEDADHWYIIASGDDLEGAVKRTLDETHGFLVQRLPLEANEVGMLMSIIGDLQISQIVDPRITCRMALPKSALAGYDLSY